ncbi:MAG: hypothetical protein KJ624_00055 [Chloroflexi bacterium]|nr:hypothetical protein [Chloroflexota bacterium]
MTVRLSDHRVSLVLRYMFQGLPQQAVAGKVGVDQSTISLWFSRFKARTAEIGLSGAGKEFGIMNEVDSLRSLAVELFKNRFSVQDARQGVAIIRAFVTLGVPPGQHKDLVRVCKKVAEPGFIPAALELCQLEAKAGVSYKQVLRQFKDMGSEVQHLKSEGAEQSSQLSGLKSAVADRRAELASLDAQHAQRCKEVAEEEKKLEKELKKKMEGAKVKAQEVEMLSKLKAELSKHGLDLETLLNLAKEFKHGK